MLAAILAYWPARTAPFLFDDQASIVGNATIRSLDPIAQVLSPPRDTPVAGRPLVNLSFALNYTFGNLNPGGYRSVNLAIHLLAGLVLFALVRRILLLPSLAPQFGARATDLAFACALLWTLHPLQTEAINYVTERTESLMGLCYLLTLYFSLRGSTVAAVLACAAGMLSKESMATAPVVVLLIDRVLVFDSWRAIFTTRRRLYAWLTATWVILAVLLMQAPRTSAGFGTTISPSLYLLNQATLIPHYLMLVGWPRALVLDYGLPQALPFGDVMLPGLVVSVLLIVTIVAFFYVPAVGLIGACCFITLAPTSSVIPIATEVGAERRMYLPLAAIVVGVVLAWDQFVARGRRTTVSVVVLATAGALMITGIVLRDRDYVSALVMARTIVDRWPSGRGHYLLGTALLEADRHAEGMAELRESARDYPGALYAIGTEQLGADQLDEGIHTLQQFIDALPTHVNVVPAREMIGRTYAARGNLSRAAEEAREVVRLAPQYAGGHDLLARVLAARGDLAAARSEFETVMRLDPGNVAARQALAALAR